MGLFILFYDCCMFCMFFFFFLVLPPMTPNRPVQTPSAQLGEMHMFDLQMALMFDWAKYSAFVVISWAATSIVFAEVIVNKNVFAVLFIWTFSIPMTEVYFDLIVQYPLYLILKSMHASGFRIFCKLQHLLHLLHHIECFYVGGTDWYCLAMFIF